MFTNNLLYNKLWENIKIRHHKEYSEWQILKKLIKPGDRLLEFGPGVRPRLPFSASVFLDISGEAVNRLKRSGAEVIKCSPEKMPFPDQCFDLVCGFDVLEHIEDDRRVFNETERVLKNKGKFIFSVPLQQSFYNEFDRACGHLRRYEVKELAEKLSQAGLKIIAVSGHGLRLKSRFADRIGAFFLTKAPGLSIRISNIFYGLLLKKMKRKIKLVEADFVEKMGDMHSVLIVAEKQKN